MRITKAERIYECDIKNWIEAFNSLKLVYPFFEHECYNCGDYISGEKMWRERVYVSGDFTSFGRYTRFYLCTKCAKTKMDAFKIFKGKKAAKFIRDKEMNE
jgi:hypothetical protein